MKPCEPIFDVCKGCGLEESDVKNCKAEKLLWQSITEKLTEDEILFILWLVAKAKGAGEWTVEEFTDTLNKQGFL